MPAACVSACEECAQPSKYTCPACGAHTCSLVCTKKHKTTTCDTNTAAPAPSTAQQQVTPSATPTPSTSGDRRTLPRKRKAEEFIPLSEYGEHDLLADYRFLNHIGRFAEQAGRDLVRSRIIRSGTGGSVVPLTPAAQTALGTAAAATAVPGPRGRDGQGEGGGKNGAGALSLAQQRMEALRKQLAYRRIPIMLLPEGMRNRRRNQSSWRGREKEMVFTMEVKFPFGQSRKGKEKENDMDIVMRTSVDDEEAPTKQLDEECSWQECFLIPHAPGSSRLVTSIGAEVLQKAGVRPERLPSTKARRGKRQQTKEGQDTPHSQHDRADWQSVDGSIWAQLGLQEETHVSDVDMDSSMPVSTLLPPGTHLLIPLHPMKLRNESSLKYIQWYERHGKSAEEEAAKGGVGVDDAAGGRHGAQPSQGQPGLPDPQDAQGAEGRGRDNGWAGMRQQRTDTAVEDVPPQIEAHASGTYPTSHAYPTYDYGIYAHGQSYTNGVAYGQGHGYGYVQPVQQAAVPLFSTSLLQNLSQKVDSIQQQRLQAQWGQHPIEHTPAPQILPDTVADENLVTKEEAAASSAASETASAPKVARTMLEIGGGSDLTVEDVLRKIPWGWGLVEFPTVELWPEEKYRDALRGGRIQVLPPQGSAPDPQDKAVSKKLQDEPGDVDAARSGVAGTQLGARGDGNVSTRAVGTSSANGSSSAATGIVAIGVRGRGPGQALTLVAYGSSDEEGSDQDDDDDGPPEEFSSRGPNDVVQKGGGDVCGKVHSGARPTSALDSAPAPASSSVTPVSDAVGAGQRDGDSPTRAEDDDDGEDDGRTGAIAAGGGLAALAQQLGWGASTPP
ncbi:unnamed protein product [Tilletia controversa]|nr:unnamed protein product [Tilletia controversa]